MKKLLCVLFLLFSILAFSQQAKIDSLSIEFHKATQDTIKARLLSEIGVTLYSTNIKEGKRMNDSLLSFTTKMQNKYYAQGLRMQGTYSLIDRDYENSEKNYLKALQLSIELGDLKLQSALFGNLGTLFGWQEQREKAIGFYEKSINLNDSLGFEKNNIRPCINIAITLSQFNKLEDANGYLIKALEIAEKHNSDQLTYLYNEIANNYLRSEIYDKSEEYLNKALPIAEKLEDNIAMGRISNSLGYLYETRDEDWNKTLIYYEKALKYHKLSGHTLSIIDAYGNCGTQYRRLGNYIKSEAYFKQALSLASEKKSIDKIITSNLNLSELYAKRKNTRQAILYLNTANELIGSESKITYRNHFFRLGNLFAENNSYKVAYENMRSFAVLSDSLYKENNLNKISEVEAKYQTEKKEKENLQLRTENVEQELATANANRLKLIFAIGLLGALLALGIFAFYYRKNKKQKEVIESLQKELHHRVKNNLSIIDTFIEVAKEEFEDDKFTHKLTELQNRIDSINEVHLQLYQSDDITNVNIKKYVAKLSRNVQDSFNNQEIRIHVNVPSNINLDPNKSFPLGLIINEFLTNSFKHAFDEKEGEVRIAVSETNSNLELVLSDNGKGLPKNFDIQTSESFGLRIMKLLSEQLDGSFDLQSNDGVNLTIQFPK